jgi:hypothetical protein
MLGDEDPEVVAAATAEMEALLAASEERGLSLVNRCDEALAVADVLIGQAQARRNMAKRLIALAQRDEHRIERVQDVALKVLRAKFPNNKTIELPMHELRSRKSSALWIDEEKVDIDSLPENCVRVKKEFDKTAIKAAIKAGQSFEGIEVQERINWNVSSYTAYNE